ncbi:cytochrome c4 [Ectothiorhodospiraceae bacterium 2226]|nr:cytochrome c4 [Ectothiorhodospiraceae bacterium 2226]
MRAKLLLIAAIALSLTALAGAQPPVGLEGALEDPQAEPSTRVAWTVETRRLVRGGDAQRGERLAQDCASCHGATGVSPSPNFPSLAGQLPEYTFKQLHDYHLGNRVHPIMTALTEVMEIQDMADMAMWYAAQPLPPPQTAEPPDDIALQLVRRGDAARFIPACAVCHGPQGQGRAVDKAALAGQPELYFRTTMRAYRDETRANDLYGVMRVIASELTDEEIDALARYYAGLGTEP